MVKMTLEENRLKALFKEAFVEVLEERQDLVRNIFEEALEDGALARAIEEGEQTKTVSRHEVFELFRRSE